MMIECPKCKGRKFIGIFKYKKYGRFKKLCPKCYGRGKVDWISNIFGVHEQPYQIIGRSELYNKFYNYIFFCKNSSFPYIVYKNVIIETPDCNIKRERLL